MLGFRYLFLCGVLAISLISVSGLNSEEMGAIRSIAVPFMMECGKEYGVAEEEFKAAKQAGTLEHLDSCFLSCLFKKFGIFNSKGMFDIEASTVIAKTLLSEEQQNALKIIQICAAVNDQTVSDGEKGCERSKLWIKCYMPLKKTLPGTP